MLLVQFVILRLVGEECLSEPEGVVLAIQRITGIELMKISLLFFRSNLRIRRKSGVHGIFIGPSDLSASMGHLADYSHPEVQEKLAEIGQLCRSIGTPLWILATGEADARRYIEMGYQFVGLGADSGLIKKASRDLARLF